MDLLSKLLDDHATDLVGALREKADFDPSQAEAFLPEAGSSMVEAFAAQAGGLDLTSLASSANVQRLIGGIDLAGLSSRSGVPESQAAGGLAAIVPMVLGFLERSGGSDGGLGALLGRADDLGDAVQKLRGLGKLFG